MQSKFTAWMGKSDYFKNAVWELKLCKSGVALSYSAFRPQQIPSLYKAKHGRVYKKLSDADRSIKPFDCMQVCYAEAWVVAGWYDKGHGISAYWIDIDVFIQEQESSTRKSLTEFIARRIASKIIKL